ncbi:MAG: prepilin-type N-terminal cleavage/methylation domain-containing protein [Acidobacteria bacterium]|nr:prepilin-type N-terminal cleavage/methylation domain-containing protein [Acidobacteriota bacterium]
MNHSLRHPQPVVSRRRRHGFSLLELLIVLALFSVVMGAVFITLDYAKKTSFTNNQLVDTQQNVRASAKIMADDVITLGQDFMGQISLDSVYVRRGFLTANGFPDADVNINPAYDELFAAQWANNVNSTTAVLGVDTNGDPVTNIRVAPGAGPAILGDGAAGYVPAYGNGTDQLLFVQADSITLRFDDDFGLLQPDADTEIELGEAKYFAQANFAGSDLTLLPLAGSVPASNFDNTTTAALIDQADRLLARRLVPMVDVIVVRNTTGGAQFMGLVTAVDQNTGAITLSFDDDPIRLTPDWTYPLTQASGGRAGTHPRLCGQGDVVSIRRGRLLRYFIGSYINTPAGVPADYCALYRRDGARIDPVAFSVENMHCTLLLVDEERLNAGAGQFYTVPGPVLADLNAVPPQPPAGGRTRRWSRTVIRSLRVHLFARSDELDPTLNRDDPGPLGAKKGDYLRINQEFTIALRNSAYNR